MLVNFNSYTKLQLSNAKQPFVIEIKTNKKLVFFDKQTVYYL